MKPERAIEILMEIQSDWEDGEEYEAFSLAISTLEKEVAKKPLIEAWSPARCCHCGEELSYHIGDGYYRHSTFLDRCPKCHQKLNWD